MCYDIARLSLWVGRAGCGLRFYAVAGVSGCYAWYGRVGVWDDGSMLFGFFRRVVWWVRGREWGSSWVCVVVRGLLRVVVVCEGGSF